MLPVQLLKRRCLFRFNNMEWDQLEVTFGTFINLFVIAKHLKSGLKLETSSDFEIQLINSIMKRSFPP